MKQAGAILVLLLAVAAMVAAVGGLIVFDWTPPMTPGGPL